MNKIKLERDMPHTSSVRGITKTEGKQPPFIQLSGQTIQYLGRFYHLQSGDKLDPSLPRKLGDWNYFPWWLYFKEMAPRSLRKHSWVMRQARGLFNYHEDLHTFEKDRERNSGKKGEGENLSACFQRRENLYLPLHLFQHWRMNKGFPGGSDSKESTCNAGYPDSIPGSGRSPGEEMAIHSSILAWKILWT